MVTKFDTFPYQNFSTRMNTNGIAEHILCVSNLFLVFHEALPRVMHLYRDFFASYLDIV